jgi:hypothetical protein
MDNPQGFEETLEWLIKDKNCELFYDQEIYKYFIYQYDTSDEGKSPIANASRLDAVITGAYEELKDE